MNRSRLLAIIPLLLSGCVQPRPAPPELMSTTAAPLPAPTAGIPKFPAVRLHCGLGSSSDWQPTNDVLFSILAIEEAVDVPAQPNLPPGIAFTYPYVLAHDGIEGEVTARLEIAADGLVSNVTVTSASRREFRDEALRTLPKLIFLPARRAGEPLACHLECHIRFSLPDL